jgi:predicted ArsR family transcriptional regulator
MPMPDQDTSQDRILYQIKRLGPQTARALAESIGMTTMGIRQHLKQLESDGLVSAMPEEHRPRGRPVHRWKLTAGGHNRFPDGHGQITSELIASVKEICGEKTLDTIIARRTRDTLQHYRQKMGAASNLEDRIGILCRLRSEEGYMAEYESTTDGFLLKEHHCPICIAAESCQGFCRSELEVFQSLFTGAATVAREDHLLAGARRCTYRIRPIA